MKLIWLADWCEKHLFQVGDEVTSLKLLRKAGSSRKKVSLFTLAPAIFAVLSLAMVPVSAADKKAEAKVEGKAEAVTWTSMFDGKTLTGWKETGFAGRAGIDVKDGAMVVHLGDPLNGVNYTNAFPKTNYEISLEAQRRDGSDFFCGLTVPVGTNACTFVLGGWGGAVVGISSLDNMDASENETTKYMKFDKGKWYRVRVRVTPDKLEAWIDDEKMADVDIKDKKVNMRPGEIELSEPIGLATFITQSAYRDIKMRKLEPASAKK